ncbi:MAG: 50S ribosomal protein L23 [Alphaproteobacteria bacterium]
MSKDATRSRWYEIIRSPIVTEKATGMADHNQVAFRVAADATKPEIKAAVEGLFGVKVTAVNTLIAKGKIKSFRGRKGYRPGYKKAVVSIAEGQTIDVMTGV